MSCVFPKPFQGSPEALKKCGTNKVGLYLDSLCSLHHSEEGGHVHDKPSWLPLACLLSLLLMETILQQLMGGLSKYLYSLHPSQLVSMYWVNSNCKAPSGQACTDHSDNGTRCHVRFVRERTQKDISTAPFPQGFNSAKQISPEAGSARLGVSLASKEQSSHLSALQRDLVATTPTAPGSLRRTGLRWPGVKPAVRPFALPRPSVHPPSRPTQRKTHWEAVLRFLPSQHG